MEQLWPGGFALLLPACGTLNHMRGPSSDVRTSEAMSWPRWLVLVCLPAGRVRHML